MSEVQSYALTGLMAVTSDRGALLTLASVLHSRGAEVIEAELRRPRHGVRAFSATFLATPRQATTVLRTVENQIDVLEATVCDHFDRRSA